jgi:hypothetical protein
MTDYKGYTDLIYYTISAGMKCGGLAHCRLQAPSDRSLSYCIQLFHGLFSMIMEQADVHRESIVMKYLLAVGVYSF